MKFTTAGVPFEAIDISAPENEELLDYYRGRGLASTPIVTDGAGIEFAGMVPDKIQEVIDTYGK